MLSNEVSVLIMRLVMCFVIKIHLKRLITKVLRAERACAPEVVMVVATKHARLRILRLQVWLVIKQCLLLNRCQIIVIMNVLVNSSRCFCHSFTCVPQNSASRVKLAKSVTS